ncbi:hypothetical protein ACFXAF_00410 [Kitasatospora sp. NPDC059463]|uniref:hypothetical protein n=1 Tax=unclassified Kitasatospora TaxID=2633591 RepID=UPI00369D16CB
MPIRYLLANFLMTTIVAGVGFWLGVALHPDLGGQRESSAVVEFNSGFSDAKRDDCQQGFAAACRWLDAR